MLLKYKPPLGKEMWIPNRPRLSNFITTIFDAPNLDVYTTYRAFKALFGLCVEVSQIGNIDAPSYILLTHTYMATLYKTFIVNCSIQKRPSYVSDNSGHYNLPLFLAFKVNIYIPSIAHILFMLFLLSPLLLQVVNMWFIEQPLKKVLLEVPLQIDEVHKTMANTAAILLDAFVDSFFEFLDQPLLPSQVPI